MSKGIIIKYTIVPNTGRQEFACAGLFRDMQEWRAFRAQEERRPGTSSVIFEDSYPNRGTLTFDDAMDDVVDFYGNI